MLRYRQSIDIDGNAGITAEIFGSVMLPAVPVAKGADHSMTATTDSIRQFIFSSLSEMNYDTDGIDNDSELGPRGADLASLALVELALRVEEEFGVKFSEEEAEELAGKTVGEFCAIVAERLPAAGATAQ
jgi:acyl carrier protein